ncbi:MAG: metalloregulator ArsR/SmtB family transcription factor [Methanoregula sp.]|nr:metalloregulator ArsR/SmtB family transcription factor [Methanoregula sp.]MDD5023774.1 metalloregulator ArsR/SmtB family transcription factor [Methanoregula sp.]MDD5186991.1 metalloregulator ArsR/SmtB family transcription factor [Methanoregula sp.]
MATKRQGTKLKKEPMCRTEIPGIIQFDLEEVGGVNGLNKRLPSKKNIEKISAIHHALSDPVRIHILYLLAIQPLCVCVIKECIGIAGSKLSYHLNIMKESGLVDSEQQGNWIIYRITEKGKKYAEETA